MELRSMKDVREECDTYPGLLAKYLRHFPYYYPLSLLDGTGMEVPSQRKSMVSLSREAVCVAEWLERQGLRKGDRVLMVFLPSVDILVAFFGCMLCGVVPVPVPPPLRLDSDLPSFSAIAKAVGAKHCVSHTEYQKISTMLTAKTRFYSFFSTRKAPTWPEMAWLYVDFPLGPVRNREPSDDEIKSLQEKMDGYSAKVSPDDLAYLQLTSGSTGHPKAVMVAHRAGMYHALMCLGNPIHREPSDPPGSLTPSFPKVFRDQQAKLAVLSQRPHNPMTPENAFSTTVWVPYYHDFFFALLNTSLIFGSTLLIMSPLDFLKKPSAWVCAMDRYGVTDMAHTTDDQTQKRERFWELTCKLTLTHTERFTHTTPHNATLSHTRLQCTSTC